MGEIILKDPHGSVLSIEIKITLIPNSFAKTTMGASITSSVISVVMPIFKKSAFDSRIVLLLESINAIAPSDTAIDTNAHSGGDWILMATFSCG